MSGSRSLIVFWRLHLALAVCVVLAETVGIVRITVFDLTLVFLPLVFAFVAAVLLNPNVVGWHRRWIGKDETRAAARALSVSVMPLIALLSAYIGPQFSEVASVGAALVLQEFGNLGTMLISMPLAVLAFRMGREAVGATFSIAREGGLAFIFGKYGGRSPEAAGVLSVYICGTFFGVLFFGLLPPVIAGLGAFDPRALAMACGTGSASMTGACATTLAALYPAEAEEIAALAASSNLMTGLTGLFMVIFVTLPLAERYYRLLSDRRTAARQQSEAGE